MRLAQTQVWPLLRYFETIAPSTAASRSASSKTMKGALPPSSIEHFSTWSAAWRSRMRPTSVEPVKVSLRTLGFSQNSLPMSDDLDEGTIESTPFGMPGPVGQHAEGERRERRLGGRPGDEGAARRQRRAGLAGDHGVREVPGRDRGGDADRLLDHGDALVALVAGDRLAVDALGLFGEPLDEARAVHDLALGLGVRLALLGGQDRAEVVGVGDHQLVPFAQDRGALLAGPGGPFLLRRIGGIDGARRLGAGQVGDLGDHVAAGGVLDGEGRAAVGVAPLAAQIGLGREQVGVLQQLGEVGVRVEHDVAPFLVGPARAELRAEARPGIRLPTLAPLSHVRQIAPASAEFNQMQAPAHRVHARARVHASASHWNHSEREIRLTPSKGLGGASRHGLPGRSGRTLF